jgi:hypothetical protein
MALINEQSELPGATETEGEPVVGTNNDERLAFMNRLNDQVDAGRADELADVNDDGSTTEFVAQMPVEEEEVLDTDAELEAIAPPPVEAQPKFKIKVNGKEIELTQDELIIRAQKVEAADAYLAEAVRVRKAQYDAVNQQQQQLPDQDAIAAAEDEERAMVRALQMGTEEEAVAAIRKLKSNAPSVTADDISRTVDERLTFKEAARLFQDEYKDVMADPVLRGLVLQKDQALLNAGDRRDYLERYREVGEEVRAWRDSMVRANAPDVQKTEVPVSNKQLRKAAAPSVPAAASRKAAPAAVDEDKEESMSDIIANIAKARGGPQWART